MTLAQDLQSLAYRAETIGVNNAKEALSPNIVNDLFREERMQHAANALTVAAHLTQIAQRYREEEK